MIDSKRSTKKGKHMEIEDYEIRIRKIGKQWTVSNDSLNKILVHAISQLGDKSCHLIEPEQFCIIEDVEISKIEFMHKT